MSRGIAFTQYLRGENEHEYPEGIVREVWSSDWQQTFEDAGLSKEVQRTLYQHRILDDSSGAQFPAWDEIQDVMTDVMVWYIHDEDRAYEDFCLWLAKVVDAGKRVSGDDSYFDYYPDQFHVADQIAKQMSPKWEERVQEAKKAVYDLGLYHDEDAIDHGYPVDGGITGIVGGKG